MGRLSLRRIPPLGTILLLTILPLLLRWRRVSLLSTLWRAILPLLLPIRRLLAILSLPLRRLLTVLPLSLGRVWRLLAILAWRRSTILAWWRSAVLALSLRCAVGRLSAWGRGAVLTLGSAILTLWCSICLLSAGWPVGFLVLGIVA